MSDYLFSSAVTNIGSLSQSLSEIYATNVPKTQEFHGDWGSLAITQGHYCGFLPYENDQHIMVVIGGPVLYFRDNDFLTAEASSEATEAIYSRWIVEKRILWDEDLSGPFTVLLVDKKRKTVTVVTDLMAFIPVYSCQKSGELYLGTHVDALAKAAGEEGMFDKVSLADFVLNDAVTYPYTAYKSLRQVTPSSEVSYSGPELQPTTSSYWIPKEENPYANLQEAAEALRCGISGYVERVTQKMSRVAQFISAGEDSRALSGLLPERLQRDAYVFLDDMNREGKIAKRVAEIYGANFTVGYRTSTHYLEILPEASNLVGSGHQYCHSHSLGFDREYRLASYSAVFGGYLSDSLLKGVFARKLRGADRLPFLPQFYLSGESRRKPINSSVINKKILAEINQRRKERFSVIQSERPVTAHEWFVLRPASMRVAIPNFYSTRRLFASYEPFMCKEAVKVSAAVPTSWKLNRRLFNRAMKPYLKKSKWLLHADGRLPYFGWWMNMPLQVCIWSARHLTSLLGLNNGNQGPWGDWRWNVKSEKWVGMVDKYRDSQLIVDILSDEENTEKVFSFERLRVISRVNLMQSLYLYEHKSSI